jgi:hypothetical protein
MTAGPAFPCRSTITLPPLVRDRCGPGHDPLSPAAGRPDTAQIPPADHEPDDHARRAARTYSAAADHYCLPALGFWDRYGAATVSRLPLAPGHAVLDLCCGAGASAIPGGADGGPGRASARDRRRGLAAEARADKSHARRSGQRRLPPVRRDQDRTARRLIRRSHLSIRRVLRRGHGSVRGRDVATGTPRAERWPSPPGVRACSSRPAACSGPPSARSSRRSTGRSAHGMRSPPRRRSPTCSRAAASPALSLRRCRASTGSGALVTSGMSCSVPDTARPSMISQQGNARNCASGFSWRCKNAPLPRCARTWSSRPRIGR